MKIQVGRLALLLLLHVVCVTGIRTLEHWKSVWKTLPPPQESQVTSLSGFYNADVLYASGLPIVRFFLKTLINFTWKGVAFDSDADTGTLQFRIPFTAPEEGTYSYSNSSTHDGMPCFRLDLSNRFYEGRFDAIGNLINIVTFTDGSFSDSDGISDVHKLSTKWQLI